MNDQLIIFVAYGSHGDIYPLLSIASAMKASHNLVFIANEYYSDVVSAAGVNYFPAGTREEQLSALETKNLSGETGQGCMAHFHSLVGTNIKRVHDYVQSRYLENKTILVVTHGSVSPAFPVCEKYRLPVVRLHYGPSQVPNNHENEILYETHWGKSEWFERYIVQTFKKIDNLFRQPTSDYNGYRAEIGVRPEYSPIKTKIKDFITRKEKFQKLDVVLEIVMSPRWFCEPIGRNISHMHFVGFPFYSDSCGVSFHKIDEFISDNGSPVVFTPGTAVEDMDEFCSVIESTCKLLGLPGIFLSRHGENQFKRLHTDPSVKLLYLDHAPLDYLLPKSKLLIHHGGLGTVAQAVRAGIPQIIRPRMYDQPNNGLRVMINGLGGMCYGDGYTAEAIADMYSYLCESEHHKHCLDIYSEASRSENSAGEASRLIEKTLFKIVNKQKPLLVTQSFSRLSAREH